MSDIDDAISVIESAAGFSDESTPCGNALNVLLSELHRLREQVRVLREECESGRCYMDKYPDLRLSDRASWMDARDATDAAKAMEDKCPPTT